MLIPKFKARRYVAEDFVSGDGLLFKREVDRFGAVEWWARQPNSDDNNRWTEVKHAGVIKALNEEYQRWQETDHAPEDDVGLLA